MKKYVNPFWINLIFKWYNKRRFRFDWQDAFKLMVAEGLNDPYSKRQCAFTQTNYIVDP